MKHWALQDAKARLSELMRAAEKEPQIITHRGEPKVEVRAIRKKKSKRPMSLVEALRAVPRVPEFELPLRKNHVLKGVSLK
jgi:prevent-host-death family protein